MGPNIENKENKEYNGPDQERIQYLLDRLNTVGLTAVERAELESVNVDLFMENGWGEDEEDENGWGEDEDDEIITEINIVTQFFERFPAAYNGIPNYTGQDIHDAAIELRLYRTVDLHEGTVSLRTILDILNT